MRVFDNAIALRGIDPSETDAPVKEAMAGGTDAPEIAGDKAHGQVVEHVAGRPLRRSALQAEQFAGVALLPAPLAPLLVKLAKVAAVDQERPPGCENGEARIDPVPHGLLVHAEQSSHFLNGVAAVNFGAPRVEASLAGHGSRRAGFDELTNVLGAPHCGPRPNF